MQPIPTVDPAATTGRLRAMLDGVAARHGRVPAMVRVLARSPAALGGYFGFYAALGNGVLSGGLREFLAIAVAEANGCAACRAAHTRFGRDDAEPEAELGAAGMADSVDPATEAALRFALTAMRTIGHVPAAALAELRAAGWSDAAGVEILAVVFLNMFSNAVNHVADTETDHAPVPPLHRVEA